MKESEGNGKRSVYSLLKTGGRLDIAVFALTVLLAVVTVFSLWFLFRPQAPVESENDFMAVGIINFIFVVIAMVESCVLAALLALGCVGLAFGIRTLRAAKREDARVCGNFRAFPVFTLIHLVIFAAIGGLCCIAASEWYTLLPLLLCMAADFGCLAASFAVKLVCRARLKRRIRLSAFKSRIAEKSSPNRLTYAAARIIIYPKKRFFGAGRNSPPAVKSAKGASLRTGEIPVPTV